MTKHNFLSPKLLSSLPFRPFGIIKLYCESTQSTNLPFTHMIANSRFGTYLLIARIYCFWDVKDVSCLVLCDHPSAHHMQKLIDWWATSASPRCVIRTRGVNLQQLLSGVSVPEEINAGTNHSVLEFTKLRARTR